MNKNKIKYYYVDNKFYFVFIRHFILNKIIINIIFSKIKFVLYLKIIS